MTYIYESQLSMIDNICIDTIKVYIYIISYKYMKCLYHI